jgi:class 3 adenylate cyclase/tetratricopeptide (TPR) repeat protein
VAIRCPNCQASNDDGARFCASCGTPLARRCLTCGAEVPPQARFCPSCGAPVETEAGVVAPPLEERRLVTILFADLAGFTEHSDRADPEDVRRILVPFHAVAKEEIERFGGTLDKFIGDAAMGVFGAPMAHEDDPERAVRAALAIRDRVSDGNLPVRIAVHTGEALVTSGEGPTVGERVAGDVVNTASRLQSFAPEGAVIVGEPTERATRHVIEYEALPATRVKGKAEALHAHVAMNVRTDTPERDEDDPPPFVGRIRERELLHDLLGRTIGDRTPRLVTVVGEPGIGKTRLVQDLHEHLRTTHDGTSWHRGRCRPYGESITYAALDEIVRSIAGIAPGAAATEVRSRLDAHVGALDLSADDRDWMAVRLHPLVGLPADDDAPADGEETFTAWTRFLEASAERSPLTAVIEDLHWADEALLEFLERLMERAPDVPLFLLCTARPELFARRPGWAAAAPHSTTISLSPLTDAEMAELLSALLLRSVMSTADGEVLLRRAGGNPLYAREFVHMLEDRGADEGRGADEPLGAAGASVPDTVQALIAARLDALEAADRVVLQAAAVIGDRFWLGAIAALEPTASDLEGTLRTLQRRGLIRRSSTSAIEGEAEFSFAHALIRDVAYGRLPRAARSRLHRDMTAWLETVADTSMTAQADLLASHATRALDLARAAGLDDDIAELEASTLRYLVAAGDRQQSLDAARAATYYGQALALAPPGAERAEIRRTATSLGWRSGGMTSDEALEEYRTAGREAMEAGDPRLAARVLRRIYYQLGLRGDTAGAHDALEQAIALVEQDGGAKEVLAELYACRSEAEMFAGRSEDSLRWAERALELPHTDTVALMALHLRGNARCETGDLGGVDDLRRALEIAEDSGVAIDIVTSYSYLLEWVGLEDGPSTGLPMNRATVDLCRRRGIEGQGMWSRAEGLWLRFDAGLWDELLDEVRDLEAWAEAHGDAQITTVARLYRGRVLTLRGEADTAVALADGFMPVARQIEDLQVLAPALVVAVVAHAAAGDPPAAAALAEEFDLATADGPTEYRELYLPEVVRALIGAGEAGLAAHIVGDRPVHVRRTRLAVTSSNAMLAEARSDLDTAVERFGEAAEGWEAWGGRFEHAHALAGLARSLEALGRGDAGVDPATRARSIFESLRVAAAGAMQE